MTKYNIDCAFTRSTHTAYAAKMDELDMVDTENECAAKAGAFPQELCRYVSSSSAPMLTWLCNTGLVANKISDAGGDLPASVPFFGGVKAENQAHFNSYSYMVGIADVLDKAGVPIFENTRANDVRFVSAPRLRL